MPRMTTAAGARMCVEFSPAVIIFLKQLPKRAFAMFASAIESELLAVPLIRETVKYLCAPEKDIPVCINARLGAQFVRKHSIDRKTRVCIQRLGFDLVGLHDTPHLQVIHAAADGKLIGTMGAGGV
jgi:hypothetical protein